MSSVTQTYGANTAFIEELYERYRADPGSVSGSWREFFQDYEPRFEEEFEEEAAEQQPVAPAQVIAAPVNAPVAVPAQPPSISVTQQPATEQPSNPATELPKTPTNQTVVPLRGAAGKNQVAFMVRALLGLIETPDAAACRSRSSTRIAG